MPSPSPAASAQDLVQSLLDLAAVFITPDWTALITLIPIALGLLFVAWFLLTARAFASLGPRRRAPARIDPIPPADVHMPGGSVAPALVALGAGALFAGLVIGGPALWVGVIILTITLLVWLREAMRDYAHIEGAPTSMSVVVQEGPPPPGVHMPGPSTRPLLGALGSAALFAGLVFGGWVLVLSVVFLTWTLIGWLVDFTAEYRKVEEADRTGHLENIPTRALPTRTLQAFAVVFALVALFQLGVFPPAGPTTAGGPGASPGAPGGSPGAPGGQVPPPGTPTIVAKGLAFDVKTLEVAAGQPFTIFFRNDDPPGLPHDVDIRQGATTLKDQPTADGGTSQTYQYDALQAGEYQFICSVHPIPAMTGTLTVQ